jgi:hypothetical protein
LEERRGRKKRIKNGEEITKERFKNMERREERVEI